ncbi:MAG: hypothetical protein WCO93_02715 [bacterium]
MKTGIFIFAFCILLIGSMSAQEDKVLEETEQGREERGPSLNFGADIMSRYIWRGYDYGNSPAIQPNIYFSWEGLNIGAWGSYAFTSRSMEVDDTTIVNLGNYSECDLYISYTYKWFTLMFFDYFVINGLNVNEGNKYFNYNNETTGHTFEVSLAFEGPENWPLILSASTLVYGNDKCKDSNGVFGMGDKNNFSTYFEAAYRIKFKKIDLELKPFIGGTPFGSAWYGPYGGITNLGLTAKKGIPVTTKYSIPIQASVITNPQMQSIFLVFGISF